jgi:hypothetical protein
MSTRRKYLELLNLPQNASKDEIRKQFRKLAKQFHPDYNKSTNASELFQLIKEAYDFLMEDRPDKIYNTANLTPTEEVLRMERIRRAKERLRAKRLADEQKIKESYQRLTSGFQWKLFSSLSIISLLVSFILLIEPFLPKHIEKQIVTHYSENYNGFLEDEVLLIKTKSDKSFFCQSNLLDKLRFNDTIFIQSSLIFHHPTLIFHRSKLGISEHRIDFSVVSLFPFLSLFFQIPFWVKRKRRLTASYIFLYKFSFYIVEGLLVLFLVTQDRWFHFLLLGFF